MVTGILAPDLRNVYGPSVEFIKCDTKIAITETDSDLLAEIRKRYEVCLRIERSTKDRNHIVSQNQSELPSLNKEIISTTRPFQHRKSDNV